MSDLTFRIGYSHFWSSPIDNLFEIGPILAIYCAGYMLVAAMGALALSVGHRRRPAHAVMTAPGGAASLVAILAFAAMSVPFAILQSRHHLATAEILKRFLKLGCVAAGPAVVAAWLTLAACGRWRPTAALPEILGIVAGCYWVFSLPFVLGDAAFRIN